LLAPASACTERLVNDAHRAGMSVNAYPVSSRSEAERLDELGVDGVVADRWGVLPSASSGE
ncbi:MAG: glycerophosphodiester phosphodiesterase family protein, partial [Halobacteriales archaeon]|nr:glycerophosphodiester phosphodiesterase family protein [Halobacteriales archaeon]